MKVVLVSTYELGHQPFGLASPAAWLRNAGNQVTCVDLSHCRLPAKDVAEADLVAFYLPMHTATRLAVPAIEKVRALNPRAKLCAYGLYAPMNEPLLRGLGVEAILGGEFEAGLVELTRGRQDFPLISLDRLQFVTPDRNGLPPLDRYASLQLGDERVTAGYTEASRGCKHLCRHCPVVPVYNGVFRIVQREVVLEDVRRQVAAGARHISFGDPDFFNGPGHAMAIVEAFHSEFPNVTYDVTIKVEHLLQHRDLLPGLKATGCLFITSAVESIDDAVLARLDKGHTRAGFIEAADLMRHAGLSLAPTFIPFSPWTTWQGYRDLLRLIVELDLVENTAPIQLAIRLLIPAGSRLLELDEVRDLVGPFNAHALSYPWKHADPEVDRLLERLQVMISTAERQKATRTEIFSRIWAMTHNGVEPGLRIAPGAAIPHLSEPWYCCAEPTPEQVALV